MEKSFDSREILSGLYDFVTCQRPDGSYYGAGGAKCHKGSESSLPQSESKSGKVSAEAAAIAGSLTKEQFEAFGVEDEGKLQQNITTFQEEMKTQVERLKNGDVSKEEIDKLLVEHQDFDISKAEFVFIGMENGLDSGRAGESGAESAGQWQLATMLSGKAMMDQGMSRDDVRQAGMATDLAMRNQSKGVKGKPANPNEYITATTNLAVQATGGKNGGMTREVADATYMGGRKMATIEMMAPAASNVTDGSLSKSGQAVVNKKGINSTNPDRSAYGAMISGQAGPKFTGYSREYVKKEFEQKRAIAIGKELKSVAANNPNFQGGFGAPGSGGKYTSFQSSVIDPLARSGTPVYTTKVDLTTGKSGGGTTTKSHTLHVAELAPGKYFVSGDFSMNTPGYPTNNLHHTAYQAGIASVKNGTATKYTPPSQKSASASRQASSATKASTDRKSKQAARQTATRQKSATAKRDQELAKLSKSVDKARADRSKYKPGSAAYNKRSAKVNEALTAQRRFKKENDLL